MQRLNVLPGLSALVLLIAGPGFADTLFLQNGRTVKIDTLTCNATTCSASLKGGDIEVRAVDVVRVEPDEETDPEPVPLSASAPAAATIAPLSIEDMVAAASRKYALPRSLVRAVAKTESALNPTAVSSKGAQGVMQLMPGTAKDLGVHNAFDPAENIDAGARLLRQLLEKYDGHVALALAAYNAGAGAVARHNGVPPYRETRSYIRKVVSDYEKNEKAAVSPPVKKQ